MQGAADSPEGAGESSTLGARTCPAARPRLSHVVGKEKTGRPPFTGALDCESLQQLRSSFPLSTSFLSVFLSLASTSRWSTLYSLLRTCLFYPACLKMLDSGASHIRNPSFSCLHSETPPCPLPRKPPSQRRHRRCTAQSSTHNTSPLSSRSCIRPA